MFTTQLEASGPPLTFSSNDFEKDERREDARNQGNAIVTLPPTPF